MDRWLITFFIGSILALFMPIVPDFFYVNLFILIGAVCLFAKKSRTISGLFLGSAWILLNGFQYDDVWNKNNVDTTELFITKHSVIGKVKTIPTKTEFNLFGKSNSKKSTEYNYKFNFEVLSIDQQVLQHPFLIRLNWNKTSQVIQQGETFNLAVKFKPPHGLANQGGFNYQVWLRQHNIVATGYVIKNPTNQLFLQGTNTSIASHRQNLYSHSLTLLPKHDLSPLLTALSFGERSSIEPKTWNILNNTNTQHLIAISGLHLGLIATGSFFIINFLIRIIPLYLFFNISSKTTSALISKNARFIAILLSCSLTFYYAYLAGFSLPTIRALVMLLLFWVFRVLGIKCGLVTWLFLAIFIVLIIAPMSLISGSFWLSFYAVSLIFLTVWRFKNTLGGNNRVITWFKSLFWIQLSLSLFMLPISMLFNFQLSFVSIFANLVAVPLMSFTSIPLSLLAVLLMPLNDSISSVLYEVALLSIEVLWFWLTYLSGLSWAVEAVAFSDIIILSSIISAIGFVSFLSIRKRYVFVLLIVSGFLVTFTFYLSKKNEHWKVTVLDVGQGLSIVIEKNNKAILYDTGASYPSGFNMAEASILPYLKHKGIEQLDKIIISHSDNDHSGGLSILKESLNIIEVIANDPELNGNNKCKQGDMFVWQDLTFKVLWPLNEPEYLGDENDHSCVIKISNGVSSVLLTGDISKKTEKQLIADNQFSSELDTDVIVAPHHGSKTSSSQAFIQAVSPEYVIYSAGFMNRWNMPSTIVQQRYMAESVKAFNTANEGMIEIKILHNVAENQSENIRKSNITITSYRQGKFPFWFAQ